MDESLSSLAGPWKKAEAPFELIHHQALVALSWAPLQMAGKVYFVTMGSSSSSSLWNNSYNSSMVHIFRCICAAAESKKNDITTNRGYPTSLAKAVTSSSVFDVKHRWLKNQMRKSLNSFWSLGVWTNLLKKDKRLQKERAAQGVEAPPNDKPTWGWCFTWTGGCCTYRRHHSRGRSCNILDQEGREKGDTEVEHGTQFRTMMRNWWQYERWGEARED